MKKFIEAGIGNTWLIRTEIEDDNGKETEYRGIVKPFRLKSVYLRIWIGKSVIIFDSKEGLKKSMKDRSKLKILLGFQGS